MWFGLQLHGQEAIAQGCQFIFDRFYADTSYELTVRKIRFLSPVGAIVHLEGPVVAPGEGLPGEPDSVPLAVVQKVAGQWQIAAFHNTPFAVEQYARDGDLRRFKARTAAAGSP